MNKKDKDIIYNLNKVPVVNTSDGIFMLDFNYEQQDVLKYCLDRGFSIRGFAYTALPAEYMRQIVTTLFENPHKTFMVSDIEIWKCVHTDYTLEQFEQALQGLLINVNLSDKIEHVTDYAPALLSLIVEGNRYGFDISDNVNKGMFFNEVRYLVMDAVDRQKKKDEKKEKINDFMWQQDKQKKV